VLNRFSKNRLSLASLDRKRDFGSLVVQLLMKKKISIHDIAKELKVSSATVSLVLNGKAREHRISQELADTVMKYAEEVNYRPNLVAKSLRTGKSRILGMMVEGISNPFFSTIASFVEQEAYRDGYKLFYSSTENDPAKAKDLIRAYRERQVEGYIIAPAPGIDEEIKALIDEGLPVVVFDRQLSEIKAPTVIVDNYKGAHDAVNHFIQKGYNSIGLVTLESNQMQMTDREKGYADAVLESGGVPAVVRVPYHSSNDENVQAIKKFIKSNPQLDAILFATNYLAMAGIESIKNLKLNIPGDLGVIAFDDNPFFSLFSPTISAVSQPMNEISHEVMKQLKLKLSADKSETTPKTTVHKTKLIERESSVARVKKKRAV
jgi:LacI family transcriptional regulator